MRTERPAMAPDDQLEETRRIKWVPRPPKAKARPQPDAPAPRRSSPPHDPPPPNWRGPSGPPPGVPIADVAVPEVLSPSATGAFQIEEVVPPSAAAARGVVGRAAAVVGLLFVANRGLGLLRDVIIAGKFGTGADIDAYYAAFKIPDFLFLVIASGAFGAAFIPVFVGMLERGDERAAWRLASSMMNAALVTLAALAALGFVFARPLVQYVVAPGFKAQEQRDLAVTLTRILLLQPIFLGLGGAAMGILNAQRNFAAPALAPVTYNLGIVFGALVLTPHFGVKGLAYGVLLGAVGHFLTQLPALARTMRYTPVVSLRIAGMREVGALLVPRMFGQAVFALNFVVVTNFATRLGEGRPSAFQFGYTLFLLPHGVFALSAATVLFPTLARLAEAGEWGDFRAQYATTLRTVLFFLVPASAALIALHVAVPEAIYQLGAFNSTSTTLTGVALGTLATGLVAYGVVEIATRAFYALRDTRTPVIAGVVTIALNVPLALALSHWFGLGGLGLSLSLTTWLEMAILLVVLRRRIPGAALGLIAALAPVFWATAAMLTALLPCVWLLRRLHPATGKSLAQLAFLVVTLAIGGAVYLSVATTLGVPEVRRVRDRVRRRLGR